MGRGWAAGPGRGAAPLAGALTAERGGLIDALVADTGRRAESELEVDLVLGMIDRWARLGPDLLAPVPGTPAGPPGLVIGGDHVPYPLVAVISPWNFPLLLGLIDAIPALTAGCAALVKPSEVTPRFIGPLMRTVARVPELAAVLAVVEGAGDVGADLVGLSDLVAFTGSVPTGRRVGEAAARAFVPAFLELGGKDPAIVLAGADLERASSAVLWGGTANAGQSCLSIERVYVEQPAYDAFVESLTAKAARVGLARPRPEDPGLGPLIDPAQAAVIEEQLADAYAKGAVARCGGTVERLDGGHWCRPTVLTGVDHSMAVLTQETFGPILPVMPVADADEAVRLANDSAYGLSAAVFGPTEDAAMAVAARLEAGAISVNDAALTAMVQEGEKNSFKSSGLGGSRMGPASLRRFVRRRSYLVNRATGPDPWWHQ
ncbi:aldehyde dehydrogenase family protein [Actinomadura sp. J1-007]|uniref:aldehyde dehydrogenase family protein n=1 Tax=Actinomadura sp. J1-007 TaxID=2661913 RepID=UPI0013247505|nr:aldehyde dehydrogenase family protein [Actinomadura sp. J1-007]MWK38362.1 aldehyde dehydrogenase family protein [Actinomadura sp. J1-007]